MNIRVIERTYHWRVKEPRRWKSGDGQSGVEYEHVPKDGRWIFNGNYEFPTFTPSINCKCEARLDCDGTVLIPAWINHYVITDGMIAYQGECTHELAGQTLELLPFTEIELLTAKGEI